MKRTTAIAKPDAAQEQGRSNNKTLFFLTAAFTVLTFAISGQTGKRAFLNLGYNLYVTSNPQVLSRLSNPLRTNT